jgi:hypothetical protein
LAGGAEAADHSERARLAFIIEALDRKTIACPVRWFAHEMNTANMELCACPAPRAGSSWKFVALP